MKGLWNSVKTWPSDRHEFSVFFFRDTVYTRGRSIMRILERHIGQPVLKAMTVHSSHKLADALHNRAPLYRVFLTRVQHTISVSSFLIRRIYSYHFFARKFEIKCFRAYVLKFSVLRFHAC